MLKNLNKIIQNRNILSILLSLIIFGIIFIISLIWISSYINKQAQNLYYIMSNNNISKNIIVIEIDEETISGKKNKAWEILKEWLWRFPFDRKAYWIVIDNLNKYGVSIIAIDVIFWETSGNEESDIYFANSIKNAWNVILWTWLNSVWIIQQPYEMFNKHVLSTGYYRPNVDKVTQNVYWITPFAKFRESDVLYNHFSIAILKWFFSKVYWDETFLENNYNFTKDEIIINNKIKLLRSRENKNEILINYVKSSSFNKLSFLDVYNNSLEPEDIDNLKDKIIIIWATAKGIKDIFHTPLWNEYWVYTHANMVNTILTKNWLKYLDKDLELFLIFLFIIISVYFNISKSSYVLIFSNISLIAIFIIGVIYIPLLTNTLINFPFEFSIAILLSLTVSNIAKYLIENINKKKLNKALSEYVSKDVAQEIISWEWKVNLNWERKNIAIFFSDIEWFTSISEKFSPEDLVWFLREYLSDMSDIIMDEKWFINKYEWDAIMALWGVFWDNSRDDDSYRICKAALKQQEVLKTLNVEWKKRGFTEIKARIGMHLGDAIIWNIWSEWRKMEFTALWDSVNLASRLEGVNKFYWTYMCASENIYKMEKSNFEFRYLDKIRVKWKDKPVKIYELLWVKWRVDKNVLINKRAFEKATRLYLKKEFIQAKEIFEELINSWDNAWRMYFDMCEIYIKTPPANDWDWISVMTDK